MPILRVSYTKDPLDTGDKQPNMLSTLRNTTLRLPIRALRSAQGAWALGKGPLLVGLYTNTRLGSAPWSTRRKHVTGRNLDHTEGISPEILSLYYDRRKTTHGFGPSLSPPTNLEMFKALVESGQATTEDAVYFLASTRGELHRLPVHERQALVTKLQVGSSVLTWLRSPEYIGSSPMSESFLMRLLIWHLVVEAKGNVAFDWIVQADTEDPNSCLQGS
jgi:hypothetical protein